MAEIRVSTNAELKSAIGSAQGGDVIILANGNYGDITISQQYSGLVTFKAASKHGADFNTLSVTNAANVKLDGINTKGRFDLKWSDTVQVFNSKLESFNDVRTASGVVFDGNDVGGSMHGIFLEDVTDFKIRNNYFSDISSDLLRVMGNSYDGVIENNSMIDMVPVRYSDGTTLHSDAIQMFGRNGFNPHDITIRGNLIWDDPATGDSNLWGQGIFLADPQGAGYTGFVIENNTIYVGTPNAIFLAWGKEDVVIRDNTLIPWAGGGGGIIRLVGSDNYGTTVDENISMGILDESRDSVIGENLLYASPFDISSFSTALQKVANGGIVKAGTWKANTIEASSGNDWVQGRGGNDTLYGKAGDDLLDGMYGADTVRGQAGNDVVSGAHGLDSLYGGKGQDLLLGGVGHDELYGNSGQDLLRGGWGDDKLAGGGDNDFLDGGRGDDKVFGGNGNDILFGARGIDKVGGGSGADTFVFRERSEVDIILQFNPGEGDRIDVQDFDLSGFSELMGKAKAVDTAVHIDFGDGDLLIIRNTTLGSLDASDFLL